MSRRVAARQRRFGTFLPSGTFDPSSLGLSGWWRASYSGVPWSPSNSAGTSGSNGTLGASVVAPTTGSAVNGFTPAVFNGSTQAFAPNTAGSTDLITASALTAVVLFNASSLAAQAANFYDDAALATDNGGNWGLMVNSSGVRAGVFDSSTHQTTAISVGTGAWHMAAMRFTGGTIKCRVDSTDAANVTSVGNIGGFPASTPFFGKNFAVAAFYAGSILEIMTVKSALADSDLANIKSYFNSRYALSL